MLESLFNKVASQKDCNFTKKRLKLRCFPVKFPATGASVNIFLIYIFENPITKMLVSYFLLRILLGKYMKGISRKFTGKSHLWTFFHVKLNVYNSYFCRKRYTGYF